MDDGKHGILNGGRNLFSDFSEVAERIGGERGECRCGLRWRACTTAWPAQRSHRRCVRLDCGAQHAAPALFGQGGAPVVAAMPSAPLLFPV